MQLQLTALIFSSLLIKLHVYLTNAISREWACDKGWNEYLVGKKYNKAWLLW